MPQIILASKSPRRRELFSLITRDFLAVEADVDEHVYSALPAKEQAEKLALSKCLFAAERYPESIVVGCDTLVELGGVVFGKPLDEADAARILKALSGNTHNVYTGAAIRLPSETVSFCQKTEVTFLPMTDREIEEYVLTGDPLDKAGAYGIQGMAARYIRGITGDYFNVLGLPISEIYHLLRNRNFV